MTRLLITSHLKPWMGVTYPAQHPHLVRESQGKEEVQRQGREVSPKGLFEKGSLRPKWQEGDGTCGGSSLQGDHGAGQLCHPSQKLWTNTEGLSLYALEPSSAEQRKSSHGIEETSASV